MEAYLLSMVFSPPFTRTSTHTIPNSQEDTSQTSADTFETWKKVPTSMQLQFSSIKELMTFVASTDLKNASFSSIDDIIAHAADKACWNKTEHAAAWSLVKRELDQHMTNATEPSSTPSSNDRDSTTAIVIGSMFGGILGVAIFGCLVFAGMKLYRGEPIFSLKGVGKKAADVEKGEHVVPAGSGAGRFY